MKVLMVTNMYPTSDNPGYGIFVKTQIDSIVAEGVEVDILFINGKSSTFNYLRGIFHLHSRLRRDNYDLIHAHYGLSGIVARLQSRLPVVVSFCGDDLLGTPSKSNGLTLKSRVIVFLSQILSLLINHSIVKSKQMLNILKFGKARAKTSIIPNGINLDRFYPIPQNEAKTELGLSSGKKYVLFPHTPYERRKRLDLAEEAISILKESSKEDIDLIVVFHKTQEVVSKFMNASDCLLLTSDWEGSPNVIKEAMACNLPIVSVDCGDVKEIIEKTNACFIADRDPIDIAKKVGFVLSLGSRTNGRDHIQHLETRIIAKGIVKLYRQITNQKS